LEKSLAIAIGVAIITVAAIFLYLIYTGLLGGRQMYGLLQTQRTSGA